MDTKNLNIRDLCRRLADLLDEADNGSGPWLLIPTVARSLYKALEEKLEAKELD